MIDLDSDICGSLGGSFSREWIETNGIGGYASASVSGANTRRYHGLLAAATRPPLGRVVMLSKFEETLIVDGTALELSSNQYPGTFDPEGYKYRPDRVILKNNNATVIDYKFGQEERAFHIRQLRGYSDFLTEMGYKPVKACLYYVSLGKLITI